MTNDIVIAVGASVATVACFGKRGLTPAVLAGVVGWVYSEVTAIVLTGWLVLLLVRKLQAPEEEPDGFDDDDIIDAEYEVISESH